MHVVLLLIPYLLAVALGVFCFRRRAEPRVSRGKALLLSVLFGAMACVFAFMVWFIPFIILNTVNVCVLVVCLMVSVGLLLRVISPLPPGMALAAGTVLAVIMWGAFDLRFRLEVRETSGAPAAVAAQSIKLRYFPRDHGIFSLDSYEEYAGFPLGKGRVYFGFLVWKKRRDLWQFLPERYGSAPQEWRRWPVRWDLPADGVSRQGLGLRGW